jgi:phage regulator Rha-like protein
MKKNKGFDSLKKDLEELANLQRLILEAQQACKESQEELMKFPEHREFLKRSL